MADKILEKEIITCGQPMTSLLLITEGRVLVSYPGGTYLLGKGDVIGICEICSEVHFLSYTASEDAAFYTYPLANIDSLDLLLQKQPDMARLFLLSCFRQISTLWNHCSISEMNCSNLYRSLTEGYEKYLSLCIRYRHTARTLDNYDTVSAYLDDDTPDYWLNGYYLGLARLYASENHRLLLQEAAVSSGMLRKGSLDFRKAFQILDEQYRYQQQLADYFFNEGGNDLFDFYCSLYYKLDAASEDAANIRADIEHIIHQLTDIRTLDSKLIERRAASFRSSTAFKTDTPSVEKELSGADKLILTELTDSLNTILDFAGLEAEASASFRQHINAYRALPDRTAVDDECDRLRKQITKEFYILYSAVFERSLETTRLPAPVQLFLYFGFVDEELAGTANAAVLYRIAQTITDHSSMGLYTFYDWLTAIYQGRKEPSRNEFEQDFSDYIHKLKQNKHVPESHVRAIENDPMARVRYELENLFPSGNKITFGRIATFCPVFTSDNVLKDLEESYVTLARLCKVIEQVKRIDYSAFYRESFDMDNIKVMNKELIHIEFLPDVILMPNAGIRGAMWQEIEGKRRNSPGRFLFSIFHMEDLQTSFIRLTGDFRWELCKRIQGGHWNDISDKSLTSEYFDYIQFYRKNHDLTPEAKEKIRASLQRAKNSFKEMFIRDYLVWILFEGNGSPRLNRTARQILFAYCPFPADICETLEQNPLYTEAMARNRVKRAQRVHHLTLLIQKMRSSGIRVPDTLERELEFAEGKPSN